MKKVSVVIIFLLFHVAIVYAGDGPMDYHWGIPIGKVECAPGKSEAGIQLCNKFGGEFILKNKRIAPISEVSYWFENNKLVRAIIKFKGNPVFMSIRGALFREYGKRDDSIRPKMQYFWDTRSSKIVLSYYLKEGSGTIVYTDIKWMK